MNKFIMVLMFLLCQAAYSAVSFMPENDLWKEDSRAVGNKEQFIKIIDIGYSLFEPFAKAKKEKLIINKLWDDSTVNANVSRSNGRVTINMYGGLARRPEVNAAGFALVLCHELGHAYGGYPYLRVYSQISAEGQADYYGAKSCLKDVLTELNEEVEGPVTSYMIDSCLNNNGIFSYDEIGLCIDALKGGQSLGNLLSLLRQEKEPSFQTPDPTVVTQTQLSYPETVQCRLDTYYNGTLNFPRPKCWFKD